MLLIGQYGHSQDHITNASQAVQVARKANKKVQCSINNVTAFSLWCISVYICAGVDCYIRVFCVQYCVYLFWILRMKLFLRKLNRLNLNVQLTSIG